jgi:hypothetical protein
MLRLSYEKIVTYWMHMDLAVDAKIATAREENTGLYLNVDVASESLLGVEVDSD